MHPVPAPPIPTLPRVQHIPADHPYVRHLESPPGAPERFRALPDPLGPLPAGTWRPSPALDVDWLAAHAGAIDVVHLHFGYEHLTAEQVIRWAEQVHRSGAGLAVTVHDVDNPHLRDQRRHHATVGAALAAADAVLTLTPGAAEEIDRRWHRRAQVIAHPHVLPLELVGSRAAPRRTDRPRIGLPLGSLRANVIAGDVLAAVADVSGVTTGVRVSEQLFAADARRADADALRQQLAAGARNGRWELDVVAPALPEEQVWRWLSSLDALLLPYGWGTHSAWAEACADVGTSVIAPSTGFWHQQHPTIRVPRWDGADAAALQHAVQRLQDPADAAGGGRVPLTAAFREAQRDAVNAQHAAVYRSVLGPGPSDLGPV